MTEAVDRGAEFLLAHRVVFSHRTGEPAHPTFMKIHYPPYWHYDLLAGLRTLAAADGLAAERAQDALDLLEEKRLLRLEPCCERRVASRFLL